MRRLFLACATLFCSSLAWGDHGIGTYYLVGKAYQGEEVLSNDSLEVRYFGMESFPAVPGDLFVPVDAYGQFSVPFYFPAHCSILNRPNLALNNPALFTFFLALYESYYPNVYLEICLRGDCQRFENEAERYYPVKIKEQDVIW